MRGQHPGLESGLGTADGTACRGIPPQTSNFAIRISSSILPQNHALPSSTSPDHASVPSKQLILPILLSHPTRPPQHFAL